jgi:hypothetical protein
MSTGGRVVELGSLAERDASSGVSGEDILSQISIAKRLLERYQ